MKKSLRFPITLFLILCFLFSTPGVSNIYADELTPTPETPVENTDIPATPAEEFENNEFQLELTEEVTNTEVVPDNEEELFTDTPQPEMVEHSIDEPSSALEDEPITIPEILEEAPEDTQIILLDENGEQLALASIEATETLASGDPVWCPISVSTPTPGLNGCSPSYSTMEDLLSELATGSYSETGVIWVADSYDGNDDHEIVIDGSILTNLNSHELGIYGGWDDGTGDGDTTGVSEFDVSLTIKNWLGTISLRNIFINNTTDANDYGLDIQANSVYLDNVSVSNTTGTKTGAKISSTSNVAVTNSAFNQNTADGLSISSSGMVTLSEVETSENTLRGAVINTCQEDSTSQLCTGSGIVLVYGSIFSNNGTSGLIIDSNNTVLLDSIQAENNALWGAKIEGNEYGIITIANSIGTLNVFSGNQTGLSINTNQTIQLERSSFTANNLGAYLLANAGISIGNSAFNENTYTGLHAESGDEINLVLVEAKNNGINGAYLIANGDITLGYTDFSGNAQSASSGGNGVYAESLAGSITTNVLTLIEDNKYGIGAHFVTHDDNPITATMFMTKGNQIGFVAESENGDISLSLSGFSSNTQGGVKAISSGSGDIYLNTVLANGNGNTNIFANTNSGDIYALYLNLSGVNDTILPLEAKTLTGLYLVTDSPDSEIYISNAILYDHIGDGAFVVTDGSVWISNSQMLDNGGNGAHILSSSSTKKCLSVSESGTSVQVTDISGTYSGNQEYGILVDSGPGGSLSLDSSGSVTNFENNLFGPSLLNILSLPLCEDQEEPVYQKENEQPDHKPSNKPFNHILVSERNGIEIPQDCSIYSGTFYEMPDGGSIQLPCPFAGGSSVRSLSSDSLPGSLNGIGQFLSGFAFSLMDHSEFLSVNPDGSINFRLKIPQDNNGKKFDIMFWDPTMNEGAGGWFILPPYEAGATFSVGENDNRLVFSGVREINGFLVFTTNFSGTFIMISE